MAAADVARCVRLRAASQETQEGVRAVQSHREASDRYAEERRQAAAAEERQALRISELERSLAAAERDLSSRVKELTTSLFTAEAAVTQQRERLQREQAAIKARSAGPEGRAGRGKRCGRAALRGRGRAAHVVLYGLGVRR